MPDHNCTNAFELRRSTKESTGTHFTAPLLLLNARWGQGGEGDDDNDDVQSSESPEPVVMKQ